MNRMQQQVRDFHRACGLAADTPIIKWNRMEHLGYGLMKEELREVLESIQDHDQVNLIKELCDLLYVVYGAAVDADIDLEPYFDEVHRSNMVKAGGPKREDGKQLKPEGWKAPDMTAVTRKLIGKPYYEETELF